LSLRALDQLSYNYKGQLMDWLEHSADIYTCAFKEHFRIRIRAAGNNNEDNSSFIENGSIRWWIERRGVIWYAVHITAWADLYDLKSAKNLNLYGTSSYPLTSARVIISFRVFNISCTFISNIFSFHFRSDCERSSTKK
jgi:hypothetical protein